MNRREFVLQASSVAAFGASLHAQPATAVKALTFDTFGTVVDYRSSIIDEGRALARKKNLSVDWEMAARLSAVNPVASGSANCRGRRSIDSIG